MIFYIACIVGSIWAITVIGWYAVKILHTLQAIEYHLSLLSQTVVECGFMGGHFIRTRDF